MENNVKRHIGLPEEGSPDIKPTVGKLYKTKWSGPHARIASVALANPLLNRLVYMPADVVVMHVRPATKTDLFNGSLSVDKYSVVLYDDVLMAMPNNCLREIDDDNNSYK